MQQAGQVQGLTAEDHIAQGQRRFRRQLFLHAHELAKGGGDLIEDGDVLAQQQLIELFG